MLSHPYQDLNTYQHLLPSLKTLSIQIALISPWAQSEPHTGREATAPSIINEIREVQGREETPPDGGVVTPKDVLMKPS
jgi:hypothetical protein